MKHLPILVAIVIFSAFEVFAQRPEENIVPVMKSSPARTMPRTDMNDFAVGDVRGTVKSVALFLPKPIYPESARKAGVEGVVRVQVTIDDKGFVTLAKTITGDGRLASSAVDAALQSKFRPAFDPAGRPVAVEGVLSYSYEIRKASWSRIAVELRGIDTGYTSRETFFVLAKTLDPAWSPEIATLGRISDLSRTARAPMFVGVNPQISSSSTQRAAGSASMSQAGGFMLEVPATEQRELARNLIEALRTRLAGDELSSWQFETGLRLFSAFYLSTVIPMPGKHGAGRFAEASSLIKESLEKRPHGVSDGVVKALQDLEKNVAVEKRTKEQDEAITISIVKILTEN